MKSLSRIVQPIFEEEQTSETPSGEKGHWITTRSGKRIFIGEPALANRRLSTLDPSKVERGRKIIEVKVPQKSGGFKTVKKYTYSDEWNRATMTYKFAIANDIEKNRGLIEGALEKEILKNGSGSSLATCALVISRTGMRVGQPGNATQNEAGESEETYGATTLERRHVSVDGDTVTFRFRGKSGVNQDIKITDKTIATGVKNILAKEGADDGPLFTKTVTINGKKQESSLRREDVSDRFKRFNEHYKPKDFRTAKAMEKAIEGVEKIVNRTHTLPKSASEVKKYAKELVKELGSHVSGTLGNTPAVAVSNYTNPFLVEWMLKQVGIKPSLLENLMTIANRTASSYDTPLLVALYGEDLVNVWFSSLAGSLSDVKEQPIEELMEATMSKKSISEATEAWVEVRGGYMKGGTGKEVSAQDAAILNDLIDGYWSMAPADIYPNGEIHNFLDEVVGTIPVSFVKLMKEHDWFPLKGTIKQRISVIAFFGKDRQPVAVAFIEAL